jgi:O-antigen/teichoic acid export membrane protein
LLDKNTGARAIGNAGILTATQIISKILGAAFVFVVARRLSVPDYGFYVFGGACGAIFGMVVAFGIPQFITRTVARELEATRRTLGSTLVVEAILLIVMHVAMAAILLSLGYPVQRVWIIGIMGSGAMLTALYSVNYAFFRAHLRMELEFAVSVSQSAANMVLGIAVLVAGLGILGLVLVQWVVYALTVAASLLLIFWKLGRPSFSPNWRPYRDLLGMAWPFALSSVFVRLYQSMDLVLLSFLKGDQATGLLAGAKNFVMIFGVLAIGLGGAFLPVLSRAAKDSAGLWPNILQRLTKYLLVIALPVCVGLSLVSGELVPLVLGHQYRGSALILQFLAFFIPLSFLNSGLSGGLISRGSEKILMRILGIMVIVSAGSQLALISLWGAYGAAAASLFTEGVMLLSQLYVLRRGGQRLPILRIALRPILSVAIMALGVYFVRGLGLIPTVLIGAVIYVVALFALRTFEIDERGALRLVWEAALARLSWRSRRKPVGPE